MKKSSENSLGQVAEKKNLSEEPVCKFMSQKPLCLTLGTKVYSAVKMLQTHAISGAPVVDKSGHLVGIVSDYDLLMQAATRDVSEAVYFNEAVQFVYENTLLREVIIILHKTKFRRLPVVDKTKKVVGVVSRIDVLMALLDLP